MNDTAQRFPFRAPAPFTSRPWAQVPGITLTEVAGCVMFGTACANMWFGIFTLTRAFIYIIAVALAFIGGGLKPRLTAAGTLFFLAGGLYILTALLYPPVPILVRDDIRNILVGFAVSVTLGLSDLTVDAWQRFQLMLHRTVLAVSAFGAILGLAKLIYFSQGGIIPWLIEDPQSGYPLGSSLRQDYNFYSLPLLLGLLSAFWLMKHDKSFPWRIGALLCVPALAGSVLLSGSRRGLITVLCALPILSTWLILSRPAARLRRLKQVLCAGFCMAAIFLALSLDSLTQRLTESEWSDSIPGVLTRWATFGEGTYSDSRIHYWTITMQRLEQFQPLDYAIGQGFGYVDDLGADPKIEEDYPHNFLLSSMLYGGVLQTACLLAMVGTALARLLRRGQDSGMMAGWFMLVLFFLCTSCNSFFSSEIAVFLALTGLGVKRLEARQPSLAEVIKSESSVHGFSQAGA